MAFRTKIDYSNNRQINQRTLTSTDLSGTTIFGVSYEDLPSGINLSTSGITQNDINVNSEFSGNTDEMIITFDNPILFNVTSYIEPITNINSGITQNVNGVFDIDETIVVDGVERVVSYSGVSFNLNVTSIVDLGGGNFSGTTVSNVDVLSASTIDYLGSTIWVRSKGSLQVDNILYANIHKPYSGNTITNDADINVLGGIFSGGTNLLDIFITTSGSSLNINFANANLNFTGNRTHNLSGNTLNIQQGSENRFGINSFGDVLFPKGVATNSNVVIGEDVARNLANGGSTIIGFEAGKNVNTSGGNTFIGWNSGKNIDAGSNVFIGADTATNLTGTTSGGNVVIGTTTVKFLTDGVTPLTTKQNSVYIGNGIQSNNNGGSGEIVIGSGAKGYGNGTVTLGTTGYILTRLFGEVEMDVISSIPTITDNSSYAIWFNTDKPNIRLKNSLGVQSNIELLFQNSNFSFIYSKSDFPIPSGGIITLEANKTYYIASDIDLTGDRLVGGANTTILGASSENCSLTSTGLGASTALFTTEWTTPIRHITFKDVGTALDINGNTNPPVALDWTGVNFLNVTNVGTINTCDNFIFSKGSFLTSKGLIITGTHGTVAFDNCLFNGNSLGGNVIELTNTCVVNRRFRITYSSVIVNSPTVGLNIHTSATIPTESYILDTVNFSGGGTYTSGVTYLDNRVNWSNCKGIINTSTFANYYMNANATPTTIASAGVAYKILGTTTANAINQKFTHTNNRATYTGEIQRDFQVTAIVTFTTGANKQIGLYVAKNGTTIPDSEMYANSGSAGRADSISVQTVLNLVEDDFIELFIENDTDTTSITVEYLNLIVKALN